MLKTLHVGIDVSHHREDVCLLDDAGARVGAPFSVPNNRPGSEALVDRKSVV